MRALALLGLLIGCDDDKAEGAGSPPQETTETVADSGSTDTGSTDTADTGSTDTDTADTGSTDTADTGSTDTDPCEGKTVGIDVGDCALNFALVDADGTTHELHSYAGQVLLLDFSGFT
ncbi:MAG: hypothetical protein P8R54_04835 [Myxococcota bacterium]|nr:hypothetical protein [Myxococcota bacterium]